jgi:hypothetical protein
MCPFVARILAVFNSKPSSQPSPKGSQPAPEHGNNDAAHVYYAHGTHGGGKTCRLRFETWARRGQAGLDHGCRAQRSSLARGQRGPSCGRPGCAPASQAARRARPRRRRPRRLCQPRCAELQLPSCGWSGWSGGVFPSTSCNLAIWLLVPECQRWVGVRSEVPLRQFTVGALDGLLLHPQVCSKSVMRADLWSGLHRRVEGTLGCGQGTAEARSFVSPLSP